MGPYDASNGTMLALGGVHGDDESTVCLRDSTIEYCRRYCASDLEVRQEARLFFNASTLRCNLVGAKVDDQGNLAIIDSYLYENYFCQENYLFLPTNILFARSGFCLVLLVCLLWVLCPITGFARLV